VLSYRHLNLHGEYVFSDQPLPAEAPFDMDLITAWQPPAKPVSCPEMNCQFFTLKTGNSFQDKTVRYVLLLSA
jgi:hypothetical protein